MLKKLILSLIMFSTTNAYAMDSFLDSIYTKKLSILNILYKCILFQLSRKNTPLQEMRADIKEFKNKLEFDAWYSFLPEDKLFLWELGLVFTTQEINTNPEKFLKYCFYQEYHHFEPTFSLKLLDNNNTLLDKCKNARINGYSALSAALMAKNMPYEERLTFANQLTTLGFQPTEKDKNIAHLKICNQVEKKYITAITFLLGDSKHNNSVPLIPDIKKHIVRLMICSEKTAY